MLEFILNTLNMVSGPIKCAQQMVAIIMMMTPSEKIILFTSRQIIFLKKKNFNVYVFLRQKETEHE